MVLSCRYLEITCMSVPARRQAKSLSRKRRSHLHMTAIHLGACAKCGATKQAHQACGVCGTYNGRQVKSVADQDARALKKTRTKASSSPKTEDKAEETTKA